MTELVLLGTGAALPGARRENTYLVIKGETSSILIDCAGDPIQRLERAGVALESLDHIILTHNHADHIYGFTILVMDLWLAGRTKALNVHGLAGTIESARTLLNAVHVEQWENLYPIEFHPVTASAIDLILITPDFTVSALAGQHYVPVFAVRITSKASGKTVTYSSDTAPTATMVELARGCDLFLHEATFLSESTAGHSSAIQAGAQAKRAGVKKLVLVHLPPDCEPKAWLAAAKEQFVGPVLVGRDGARFKF